MVDVPDPYLTEDEDTSLLTAGFDAVEIPDTMILTVEDGGESRAIGVYGGGYISSDTNRRGKSVLVLRIAGSNGDSDTPSYDVFDNVDVSTRVIGTREDADDDTFDGEYSDDDSVGVLISGRTGTGVPFVLETATDGSMSDMFGHEIPIPEEALVDTFQGGPGPALAALVDRADHVVTGIMLSAPIGAGTHWIRRGRQWIKVRDIAAFLEAIEESTYMVRKIPEGAVEVFDQSQDGGGVPMLSNVLVPRPTGVAP